MRFFRTQPSTYSVLQPQVDALYYNDWIATGRCEHILPVTLPVQADGLCYIAVPTWFFEDGTANQFLAAVEEVTQEQYQTATQTIEE